MLAKFDGPDRVFGPGGDVDDSDSNQFFRGSEGNLSSGEEELPPVGREAGVLRVPQGEEAVGDGG